MAVIKCIWITCPGWHGRTGWLEASNPGHGKLKDVVLTVRERVEADPAAAEWVPQARFRVNGQLWTFSSVSWESLIRAIEADLAEN